MDSRPFTAVLRRVAAALLLAVGVACAGPARADCGDYLTVDGKPAAHRDHPTKPCDGPNCSAAPAPVPVPMTAPAPVEGGAKASATGLLLCRDESPRVRGFSHPASDGVAVHVPRSVFHPPRNG